MSEEIKKTREIEMGLSRNLYLLCAFVTMVTMVMTVVEFFSRGVFFPNHMDLFYLGILLIYSLHKEMIRWLGRDKVERQGEYFVYGWVILTTVLYIINFTSKDYYTRMPQGGPGDTLRDTAVLTLEILAVFIFTRCLKIFQVYIKTRKIKF